MMYTIAVLCCIFLYHLSNGVMADVVTLIKDQKVICVVTGDDLNYSVYITNSSQKLNFSTIKPFRPIVKNVKSISFSACVQNLPPSINLTACSVHDQQTNFNFILPNYGRFNNSCWLTHFTIRPIGNKFTLSTNGEFIMKKVNFDIYRFRIPNDGKTFIKKHSYDILWSESIGDKTIIPLVSSEQNICVSFFASIDENCYLNITLKDRVDSVSKFVTGFNKPDKLKRWERIEIDLKSLNGNGSLILQRTSGNKEGPCFWAIDRLTYCKPNLGIFSKDLEKPTSAECQSLSFNFNKRIFNCEDKPGFFGSFCNISCEVVFGSQHRYCEGYQFLVNNTRICGWGREGSNCETKCTNGTWGINCRNACNENYNDACLEYKTTLEGTTTTNVATRSSFPENKITLANISTLESDRSCKDNSEDCNAVVSSTTIKENFDKLSNNDASPNTFRPPGIKIVNSPNPELKTNHPKKDIISTLIATLILGSSLVIGIILFISIYYLKRRREFSGPPIIKSIRSYEGNTKIETSDFERYIRTSTQNNSLHQQYYTLQNDMSKSCSIALSSRNSQKNYDHINIPYNDTRVILEPMVEVGSTDYINASYIDGYGKPKAYITAQGPKFSTCKDFWRMIWQHDVKIIIMATNFREKLQRKCVEYYPTYPDAVLPFDQLAIKLIRVENCEYYDKSILEVYWFTYKKTVLHYRLKWSPDCDKPLFPNELVPLVQLMENKCKQDDPPIVVHCNSGGNKSALLILIHLAYRMSKVEGFIDIYQLARTLRAQRPNMIQSVEHYILAHMVLTEYLIKEKDVFNPQNSSAKNQMKNLGIFHYHDQLLQRSQPRIFNDYGNCARFISAKQPKNKDVTVFWKHILDSKLNCFIFLNDSRDLNLWPHTFMESETKSCTVVKLESIYGNSNYHSTKLFLKYDDMRSTVVYRTEIWCLQTLKWKIDKSDVSSVETFINLVLEVHQLQIRNKPILLASNDGTSLVGLFMALSYIIQKYLKELSYDVGNAVRLVRRCNQRFISREEELDFLHEAVIVYSKKYDPYKNVY